MNKTTKGLFWKLFERFGVEFDSVYGEKLKKYIDGGYVLANDKCRAFSDKGFFISNFIFTLFVCILPR